MDRKIEKKKWTWKKITLILLGTVFGLFFLYSFILSSKGSKLNVSRDRIKIAQVVYGDFREFIPVDGTVMPIKTIKLDAVEGGIIEIKYLEGGTLVGIGDTIIKLSNNNMVRDFINQETQAYRLINELENTRLQLKQNNFDYKRTLKRLEYEIDEAKDIFLRSEELFEEQVISEQEFLTAKRDYLKLLDQREIEKEAQKFEQSNAEIQISQLQETLKRTTRNLEYARENLNNLYIQAPISGRLSTVNGEVGESVSPGQNIGQIDDLNGFKVGVAINEHYISRIYEELTGEFDFATRTYILRIKKIYPEVSNGLFQVEMEFVGESPEGIKRGQTLQIKLQLSEDVKAIMIPRGSFYQTTGGNWIFVIDESGEHAARREIRLGRQNPRYYETLEGLEVGEEVVVSSYNGYEDKDQLIIK